MKQPPPAHPPHQQNIIFQTAPPQPPGQISLQQLQLHPPPNLVESALNINSENNGISTKEEKGTPEPNESPIKNEDKSDTENHEITSQNEPPNHLPATHSHPQQLTASFSVASAPFVGSQTTTLMNAHTQVYESSVSNSNNFRSQFQQVKSGFGNDKIHIITKVIFIDTRPTATAKN